MTIATLIRAWSQIAERTGAAIELVHHTRKRTTSEPDAGDARGASALVNAMRSVRMLAPMSDDEAGQFELADDPDRYFRIVPVKTNLAQRTRDHEWRELVSVALGNAPDGGRGDEVGAVRAWKPPAFASPEQLEKIVAELSTGHYRLDVRAENWAGRPVAKILGLDVQNTGDRIRIKRAIRIWVEEGVLNVTQRVGDSRHVREFVTAGVRSLAAARTAAP